MKTINPLIHQRHSTVTFSSKEIEEDKLISLFEAARWAPSSYNEQPWKFIVGIKNKNEDYEKLFDCLVDANKHWAKYAPVLVLNLAETKSSVTNNTNRFAKHDLGLAIGNLLIQATHLNIYVHQMGGYHIDKARETFNIDNTYEPMSMMAIGYKGNIDLFPDDLQEREKQIRIRRPLNDLFL